MRSATAERLPAAVSRKLSENAPVRIAILGGGAVTWEFYLPALFAVRGLEVVTIVEPSAMAIDKLRELGYEGEIRAESSESFLADSAELDRQRLDGVIVALPNRFHEAAVVAALEAGLHVLCEKPLALSEAACRRMQRVAEVSGKSLSVAMVRRRPAAVVALREALALGLAGKLKRITIEDGETYQWMSESGAFFQPSSGGVLADMGVHYLDLAASLVGPLEPRHYEDDWRGGCEANVTFELEAPDGLPVRLVLSRNRPLANRMILEGTKGTLTMEKNDFSSVKWCPEGGTLEAKLQASRPFDEAWGTEFLSAFRQQLLEFREAVREGRSRLPSADEAASVIRLIEWAYARREPKQPRPLSRAWSGSRVVVTGGTGFIGSRLLERLAERGTAPPVVPVRNYRTCVEAARFEVELPRVNLGDAAAVRELVRGARFVFHLAYGRDGEDSRRITVDGTRHVVEAAIAHRAEAVVVLSTMSVFGHPETDALVDESAPYAPETEYGRTKAEMERWCLERARRSQHNGEATRIVILNPSCVYGPGGKTYARLPLELARQGQLCWVNGGRGVANYTYIDNLCDAILLAAERPEAHGKRFLINDGTCSWREFLTPLLGAHALGLPDLSPADLQALSAGERANLKDLARAILRSREVRDVVSRTRGLGTVKSWLGRNFPSLKGSAPRPLASRGEPAVSASAGSAPAPWLAELFGPTVTRFGAQAARRTLGWDPKVDLAAGHAETIKWLRWLGLFD